MPTVNALVWKNMLMNPIYGMFAVVATAFGAELPVASLGSFETSEELFTFCDLNRPEQIIRLDLILSSGRFTRTQHRQNRLAAYPPRIH